MLRLAMDGIEHSTTTDRRHAGRSGPMAVWMAQTTWRMTELLREICGSGIVMQPSENDLANPELRPSLEHFMRGKDVDVEYKSRLFRVAHELAMSSFGMRQDIYEYWHGGRPEPQPDQPAARLRPDRTSPSGSKTCAAVRCRTATCPEHHSLLQLVKFYISAASRKSRVLCVLVSS